MYLKHTDTTRSVEELQNQFDNPATPEKRLKYVDLAPIEITRIREFAPDLYKILVEEIDGATAPTETAPSAKRIVYRNGVPYEISAGVSYINGVAVS